MFQKNMNLIFGIAMIISLDVVFGLSDPRVQSSGFDTTSVPAAYDGPAITANGYNPSSYDYHTDPKIWIPRGIPEDYFDSGTENGYIPSNYGYHKLYTNAETWNVALNNCFRDGGHLAIINSAGEAEYLRSMLYQERYNIRNAVNNLNAFVGITDQNSEGYWYTIFGQPLRSTGYNSWTSYEPNNGHGHREQDCGAITTGAVGLSDVSCNVRYAYFCELQ